ncbi:MAG: hypothetical protein JOZ78_16750 [Chroococcidiopsidaceae cyanobacterium CP_BM_ER_R8_30]|nr:hypothetical protein [Chroococcidiopsidaceae cyanobacterium CP_BM_ER_R8_30]
MSQILIRGSQDKYVQAPLDLVMNNPRVTTPMLLILAVTPFVILAVILVLFFLE